MAEFLNHFNIIFSGTVGMITLAILSIAIFLMILEFFIPDFGVLGIISIALGIIGIVFRAVMGLDFEQTMILIVVYALLFGLIYGLFIASVKRGLLSRSQLFCGEPSIPYDYEKNQFQKFLLGKTGITITDCKPLGKALIDGEEIDVISDDGYLDDNIKIKVIEVTGDKVVVVKI